MSIAGDWYNEFGSHMHLTADPSGGISGTYTSGAGHVAGQYELTGRCHASGQSGHGAAVGWTVAWHNQQSAPDSVTSWSGQYFEDRERIFATWLLTRPSQAPDVWEATTVGQDVFTRDRPTAATGSVGEP
ncbi:avidin/streptavidin family protein [Kitasatospora sp. NPDC056138]|uniref:avidin/streptavidin family protein n=1 Tax=Kitasatospora sp. NPDC056138 TaxID=3345724 RepID=UPI0035D8C0F2